MSSCFCICFFVPSKPHKTKAKSAAHLLFGPVLVTIEVEAEVERYKERQGSDMDQRAAAANSAVCGAGCNYHLISRLVGREEVMAIATTSCQAGAGRPNNCCSGRTIYLFSRLYPFSSLTEHGPQICKCTQLIFREGKTNRWCIYL